MGRGIVFLLVLLIAPAVYGQTSHTVGGNSGWDSSVNYVDWARGKTFTVGDSLVFNYDISHSVDEVSSDDYSSCNTANAISSDANSPTTITLSAAGTRYFVCPRSNHCSQGQKLTVTVVSGATTPSPPTGTTPSPPTGTTPSPPTGGASPSPPSKGTTPSPPTSRTSSPPPPAGNGAAGLGGGKSLMVGLTVVVGAMLGVMG